jgi:cation/acetate symporter
VNFPALLLALWWRRFNTMGAVAGMSTGMIASIVLIIMSPPVWPGADTATGSPLGSLGLANPALFCIPLGFLGCWLGTVLSKEKGNDREYHELYVRAETGLGAEGSEEVPVRGKPRKPQPAAEPVPR